MNDFPIRLKPADRPAPRDRHEIGVDLMAALRDHATEARHLRDLFSRGGDDLIDLMGRARTRAHELEEQAARLLAEFEAYRQSERREGLFSSSYGEPAR